MTKTKKAVKKTSKKVLKVQIEEPVVEIAPETYKKDPTEQPEPTLLPSDPTPEPVVNPNDPKMEGIDTGFKRPSITNVKPAYTYEQYKELVKGYKEQSEERLKKNPSFREKYDLKMSEMEAKLKALKGQKNE